MNTLFVTPAYGKHYKSPKEVRQGWMLGDDFLILNGPYCSIRDSNFLLNDLFSSVTIVSRDRNFNTVEETVLLEEYSESLQS